MKNVEQFELMPEQRFSKAPDTFGVKKTTMSWKKSNERLDTKLPAIHVKDFSQNVQQDTGNKNPPSGSNRLRLECDTNSRPRSHTYSGYGLGSPRSTNPETLHRGSISATSSPLNRRKNSNNQIILKGVSRNDIESSVVSLNCLNIGADSRSTGSTPCSSPPVSRRPLVEENSLERLAIDNQRGRSHSFGTSSQSRKPTPSVRRKTHHDILAPRRGSDASQRDKNLTKVQSKITVDLDLKKEVIATKPNDNFDNDEGFTKQVYDRCQKWIEDVEKAKKSRTLEDINLPMASMTSE